MIKCYAERYLSIAIHLKSVASVLVTLFWCKKKKYPAYAKISEKLGENLKIYEIQKIIISRCRRDKCIHKVRMF